MEFLISVLLSLLLTLTSASLTRRVARPDPASLTSALSAPSTDSCSYWLENVQHQGVASFNPDVRYQVWRNVKDFGAKGDGTTDDTASINAAIASGNRCIPGSCNSTTTTPALVYFPSGTYLVSSPIIDYYYTQLVGNPNCLPTLKAAAGFTGGWVIDGDQYQSTGNQGYGATNIFWRQIRNFIIDTRAVDPATLIRGIHWPTGQATSIQNVQFFMSSAAGTKHEGLFIENGSGGLVVDLTFNGGNLGLDVGNQQFTMRNLHFENVVTAILQLWDWGWTYQGLTINNCQVGLNLAALGTDGSQTVGSVTLFDSSITNTPVGIITARNSTSQPTSGGSLVLENVALNNVPVAIRGFDGSTVLAGSSGQTTIQAWAQGHSYSSGQPLSVVSGPTAPNNRPASLLSGSNYYTRSRPQYETLSVDNIISARSSGATGNGNTDDTTALQNAILSAAQTGKVLFLDAGNYKVSSTIYIPPGTKITGESYPVILGAGSAFQNAGSPTPIVQVGKSGDSGSVEWSDAIVSTQGSQPGAVLIEYNMNSNGATPGGLWDVHTRIGGFAGSNLQVPQCVKQPATAYGAGNVPQKCIAASMSMSITASASGVYLENVWLWVADHDVEDSQVTQISVFAARGLQIQGSSGPIWLYGTAVEHHTLYQYQLYQASNIFMGQIQTESPYYQPNPPAPIPFTSGIATDPTFNDCSTSACSNRPNLNSAWGVRLVDSSNIFVYGVGLYSFFSNYDLTCSNQGNGEWCQNHVLSIEGCSSTNLYNLNTVGVTEMITLNSQDIAPYSDNLNGFEDTVAIFRA